MIQVVDLGLIPYGRAYALQRRCVEEVIAGGASRILTCEHPPVLTLGSLADEDHILVSGEERRRLGLDVVRTDRGGEVTLHAPGQLVAYPILDWRRRRDLHRYLHELEQAGIDFLREFGIVAQRCPGRTGVWVGRRKIASIGIGVRKWVTYHGMAINCRTDLRLFRHVRPCGLDVTMTSMEEETGIGITVAEARGALGRVLRDHFSHRVAAETGERP